MGKSGHKRASVKLIDMLLEQPDGHHAPVHFHPLFGAGRGRVGVHGRGGHFETPDICARTSKTQAKSSFSSPMPRAAVRNSLATAVVGKATLRARPISSASSMSFCIMLQSNQASSGIFNTNGPRY